MNDCVKKKANKAFNAVISNKSTTIVALVKEPFFRSKLKSPNKILIEYLNDDKTIDQICDWLLTEVYCNEKTYKPISQLIIRIFKEAPDKVLASFSTNERLISRLQQFCKFEKRYFLIGFGHFQQIVELLSFATRGVFLQNFTDFTSTLLKCIDIISIRYLFLSLASNFTQSFGFSKDVVLKMIQSMNESNQHHIIFLLSKLSRGKNTYFAFDHSKVIYSLFEIVVSPLQNEFIITQALQIIEYVKKNTIIKEKVDIILKYFESKIDFDNLPVNFSTSIILKLYNNKFIPSLILLMINNPTHMFLHEGIMASIESASDEVLIDFVEKNNVSVKLIWAMNVAKSNGFLTKFAVMLNEKRDLSPSLQTPEWDNFVSNVLNRRLLILNNQMPSQFSNMDLNSQNNSPQKKGQKRSNSTQSKKTQQQSNQKNKAKSDDEGKSQKEDKKKKDKNQKIKNDQQIENKDDSNDRNDKVKTEKIKNGQPNENKEDNSDRSSKSKSDKIKNTQLNEIKEDNSNKTGKVKNSQQNETKGDNSEKIVKVVNEKIKNTEPNENKEDNSTKVKSDKIKNTQQNENREENSNKTGKVKNIQQNDTKDDNSDNQNKTKTDKAKNEQNEIKEDNSNRTLKTKNSQQNENREDNPDQINKPKTEKVKNDQTTETKENNLTRSPKTKNCQQNDNKETNSIKSEKIKLVHQNENKEDNSDRTGKIKVEKVPKNNQQNGKNEINQDRIQKDKDQNINESKNKSKNKSKNETNIVIDTENDTIELKDENNDRDKSIFEDEKENLLQKNIFVETIIENKNIQDAETTNNNPLPKILDSLLIKNLILQRLNQNENNNNIISDKNENPNNLTENNNPSDPTNNDDNEEGISESEKMNDQNDDSNNQNNKIVNDNINNREEIQGIKRLKNKEGSKENDEVNSNTSNEKGEIKSPSKLKNPGLIVDVKINSQKFNDKKSKNEQCKTPIKQANTPFSYEPPTRSNDHCRIALIKKKLYRNNEQSPQPKSPRDEKSRGRSFSVNWSPSATQPSIISKSDDINDIESSHESGRKRRRNRINNDDYPEIQEFDFFNVSKSRNARFQRNNTSQNKKIYDLGDDFSSSSDEDKGGISINPTIIGPPSSDYFVHTIFGPAYVSSKPQNESGSDSSDGEFEFKFTPIPKRFKRKPSFNYRGTFDLAYREMPDYC